jgi:hypothetical protein
MMRRANQCKFTSNPPLPFVYDVWGDFDRLVVIRWEDEMVAGAAGGGGDDDEPGIAPAPEEGFGDSPVPEVPVPEPVAAPAVPALPAADATEP